jgi:hypothetical protein
VAAGEVTREDASASDAVELQPGSALTASGRVSVAREYEPDTPSGPFSPVQLSRLDEALTLASRDTGLDFSVYLGELGEDSRTAAERLHAAIGPEGANDVLIAVSPGERVVEVVTGPDANVRLSDRGAKLAVASMVASFKEGDLVGGLVSGLRMMADQAGSVPAH